MSMIAGIGCVIPSREITNDDIMELIKYYSTDISRHSLNNILNTASKFMSHAGSHLRYWRRHDEHPLEMMHDAIGQALCSANISRADIDLVLYVSVDRGFIEPANACFVANALGIKKARTFDIVDACMGWWSGVQVAQSFFSGGMAKCALIVSTECPMGVGQALMPDCFNIHDEKELEWKFPACTFGESVTMTIVTDDGNGLWPYSFISDSEFVHLCSVPYRDYAHIFGQIEGIQLSGPGGFTAFGQKMGEKGIKNGIKVLSSIIESLDSVDYIVPHTFSEPLPALAARKLGVVDKLYNVFPLFGNLATSSIPTALHRGIARSDFTSKHKLIGWVASAGMKFSAFHIRL
ncbi:MAG: 3-oxoacyl-[acyl-carrier-protein] synthase III C-terminal domain-containing protein [Candidatus Methylumidiphilus sp.]